jgi:hypothetical protein
MLQLGTPGAVRLPVILGLAAAGVSLGIRTARQSRAEREAEAGAAVDVAAATTESRAPASALTAAPVSPRQ